MTAKPLCNNAYINLVWPLLQEGRHIPMEPSSGYGDKISNHHVNGRGREGSIAQMLGKEPDKQAINVDDGRAGNMAQPKYGPAHFIAGQSDEITRASSSGNGKAVRGNRLMSVQAHDGCALS